MRDVFPGSLELYHIHHNSHVEDTQLHSSVHLGEENLNNVRRFIAENKYPDARIIEHSRVNKELPLIPSVLLAAQTALEREADLHLWIEDDAILFDLDCWRWPHKVACELGSYRNTVHQKMIVCSYYLSRPSFDGRLIPALHSYKKEPNWKYARYGSQYEHMLFNIGGQKLSILNSECAYRHHLHSTWRKTRADVERWLKKHLPITAEDLELLKLDFKN
jgi:hypothetical protein